MTIYYEAGIPPRLIPIKFIGWSKSPAHDITGRYDAVVKLKRDNKITGYRRGDVLHVPAWHIVEKVGQRNYRQLVKAADLPSIDYDNLIP